MSEVKKSKGTAVTEEDFQVVKILQRNGLNSNQIGNMVKRSSSTTNLMMKADTLAGYKELVREITSRAEKKAEMRNPKPEGAKPLGRPPINRDIQPAEIKNLTEAIITLTAVMNRLVGENISTKSFWRSK